MTASVKPEIIRVENLSKLFGHTAALRSVTISIREREFWTIFGPNGAGKTTLAAIIATLLRPTSGEVVLFGNSADEGGKEIRRRMSMVSHQSFLYDDLTSFENLMFFGGLFGVPDLKDRVRGTLHDMGLGPWEHQRVRHLSRGLHQRLAIARSLLHDPSLVLLDEPNAGVDHCAGLDLQKLLRSLHGGGRTVVMTTHDLRIGLELSTNVAILARGSVVYQAPNPGIDYDAFEQMYLHHAR